jgi:hypothetical protein
MSKLPSSSIVKMTAGDFCELARVTGSKDMVDRTKPTRLGKPIIRDSKIYRWCVETTRIERDIRTGIESQYLLSQIYTETEEEAKAATEWVVANSKKEREMFDQAVRADAEATRAKEVLLTSAKPPPAAEKITITDLKDYEKAQGLLLRKKYPRYFRSIAEAKSKGTERGRVELEKAYALDVAKSAGVRIEELIPPDNASMNQLKRALYRRRDSKSKALQMAVLRAEILRGWFSLGAEYCWMTNPERTKAINKALGTSYSSAAIKMQIVALDIASKRLAEGGRPEKPYTK